MTAPPFLPYGRQAIEDDDIAAVAEALRADYLTTGPTVDAFERAFAERVGAAPRGRLQQRHRGTASRRHGARPRPGDWLIVPSLTFLATANAARYVGAEVLFADVDPDTGLLTEAALVAALDQAKRAGRTVKAVSPVHLAGRTAPLAGLAKIARAHGVPIVEDACHALGTTYDAANGAPARVGDGRYGTLATFSFHPVKTIAVGEGGMITTNDPNLAARMRVARSHGMIREPQHMRDRAAAFEADGTPRSLVLRNARARLQLPSAGRAVRARHQPARQARPLRRAAARARAALRRGAQAARAARAACSAGARLRSRVASLCRSDRLSLRSGITPPAIDGPIARARHRHAGSLHPGAPAALLSRTVTAIWSCPAPTPTTTANSRCRCFRR